MGFADEISVTIHADNSITVIDNGRGIPVDVHPTEKILAGLTNHSSVVLWDIQAGLFKERKQFQRDPDSRAPPVPIPAGGEELPDPTVAAVMTFTNSMEGARQVVLGIAAILGLWLLDRRAGYLVACSASVRAPKWSP